LPRRPGLCGSDKTVGLLEKMVTPQDRHFARARPRSRN
jgi:hypothetical protein